MRSRWLCWVGLIVSVALLPAALAGGASKSKRLRVHAGFEYLNTSQGDNCGWGIGIEFGSVAGAVSYTVSYWDGYWKRQEGGTVTPAQLAQSDAQLVSEQLLSKGNNFYGVTGGTYSPPCSKEGGGDATEGGRFSQGATVYANLAPGAIVVSGRVTICKPVIHGCTNPKPRPYVNITVRRKGRAGIGYASTWSDGTYEMALPGKGTYAFTPSDEGAAHGQYGITDWVLGARTLDIRGSRSGVDFMGYDRKDFAGIPGPFANAPPGTIAGISEIKALDPSRPAVAYIRRGGTTTPLKLGDFLQPGDVVGTDGNTVMAFEFVVGGRIGINTTSEVELNTERSVKATTDSLQLHDGHVSAKPSDPRVPIEIQTNGGVMGIKG